MNIIDISGASDLNDFKDRALYRFLETLPSILSFGTLLGGVILSWWQPVIVAVFIIAFDFYWFLRVTYFGIHQLAAYKVMKKNINKDWKKKLDRNFKDWKKIKHLVILPTYKENYKILKTSFEGLKKSKYPKENLFVVLATEKRAGKEALETANKIKEEFQEEFGELLVTRHPSRKGELKAKGANLNYAGKVAKKKILDKKNLDYEKVILSSFDSDTRAYDQYFLCLTYHFLNEDKPLKRSYQPVPLYNNNIWEAPAFSRVISLSSTFWQMIMQESPKKLVTYSSHSFPFKVFNDIGYPANIVADDSRIFWKAYLNYNGDYKTIPLYYPVSMDAVFTKNIKNTVVNQYKQQRRWAWGCIEIPYVLFNFIKNKKIKLRKKIRHIFVLLEGFWSWATSAPLIFFLGWLPILLGGEKFNISILSYNLPRLTGIIMTLAMVGMVISAITTLLLIPTAPEGTSKFKKLTMALQWFLLPITLLFFGAIPALEAQARLAFGKKLGFWVTEKARA
ncbi:MAG: hypothetical protein ACOC1P_05650 [Minisyncoccales bacterium]